MTGSDIPVVTDHAEHRWLQRSDATDLGPRLAWLDGVTVPEPHPFDGDETRYHAPSDTLLVAVHEGEETIVRTVLEGTRNDCSRVLDAVERTTGGEPA
jgi:hypothetical protein